MSIDRRSFLQLIGAAIASEILPKKEKSEPEIEGAFECISDVIEDESPAELSSLYEGGRFMLIDFFAPSADHVAKWNGESWGEL